DSFNFAVTTSIRTAATGAGVSLFECDGNFNSDTSKKCADTLNSAGLDAVINWQAIAALAPTVCAAYKNLPTVAINYAQPPCEKVQVGVDSRKAGVVGGTGLGKFAQANLGCKYDLYVSIENRDLPDLFDARGGGSREGIEAICGPIPAEKDRVLKTMHGG